MISQNFLLSFILCGLSDTVRSSPARELELIRNIQKRAPFTTNRPLSTADDACKRPKHCFRTIRNHLKEESPQKMHLLALILLVSLAGRSSEDKPAIIEGLTFATKLAENKKLSLNCLLSDADPTATFEWFLNGQRVVPNENVYVNQHEDSSMLNVRSMNLEMAGDYECRVANRFGQDSRSLLVKLEGETMNHLNHLNHFKSSSILILLSKF